MQWFWNRKDTYIPGVCAVEINPDGVGFARVVRQAGALPQLTACEFVACTEQRSHRVILTDLIERHQLRGAVCNWVLLPGDYKLLSMEMLPVPKTELQEALRWRVKDLIDFPPQEAAIDFFEVPGSDKNKAGGLYVVVAHLDLLQSTAALISTSGLTLSAIDIPEMALRNILALFPEDRQGAALLAMDNLGGQVIITRQATICFARQIDFPIEQLLAASDAVATELSEAQQQILDGISLEIQRSFDYYHHQLRQALPSKCFINTKYAPIIEYLKKQFSQQPIESLNLSTVIQMENISGMNENLQRRCLNVIGAALRDELDSNATH